VTRGRFEPGLGRIGSLFSFTPRHLVDDEVRASGELVWRREL
jgi:hypothetical protein